MTAVVDNGGAVKERYAYTPYGEVTILDLNFSAVSNNVSTISNEHLYTGRRRDPETGLQLNRNRFYASHLGRWVNRDPIGYWGGTPNLYEYVYGNGLYYVDPLGYGWWGGIIGGITGGIVGGSGGIIGGALGGAIGGFLLCGPPCAVGGAIAGAKWGGAAGAIAGAISGAVDGSNEEDRGGDGLDCACQAGNNEFGIGVGVGLQCGFMAGIGQDPGGGGGGGGGDDPPDPFEPGPPDPTIGLPKPLERNIPPVEVPQIAA